MVTEGPAYHEFAPGVEVAEIVARYWCLEPPEDVAPGYRHRVLPDGCVDLVLVGRGDGFLTVRGPRDALLEVFLEPGDRFWGARLWPDVGGRLLGVDAKSLVGVQAPAASFLGAGADGFARRVALNEDGWRQEFDAFLAAHGADLPPIDMKVRLALVALQASHGGASAPELGELVGLSVRQLQRRFKAATGLTLKTYARIRRLRGVIGHLLEGPPMSWASVAASLGFADQSHLIAEFRRLAGGRPAEVARYIAGLQHSDVIP